MTADEVNLVMVPGIGADARLFSPQQLAFPRLTVLPWIEIRAGETLPDYAARLVRNVDQRRPLVLGGISFGGMLAYEMARLVPVDALVLIASCTTRAGIRPVFRLFRRLHRWLPASSVKLVGPLAPVMLRAMGGLTADDRRLCIEMFRQTDPAFLKRGLQAILNWHPSPPPNVPIYQLHGSRDPAIPVRRVQTTRVVRGAGHLVNLTHPDEVNAFIAEVLEEIDASGGVGNSGSRV